VVNNYSANTKYCGSEMLTLMEENKMIRKGLIYLTTTLMILLLVGLAIAAIPPPPVNQNIGLYDSVFFGFTTDECKDCHGDSLADRHHLLVETDGLKCTDCHKFGEHGLREFRNCSDCHESSPHHETVNAQTYQCSECHGDFVDDYDDGHYIPTYNFSMVTPDTSYNLIVSSSGLKIGGCEACHEPESSLSIESNPNTHHNLSGFSEINCAFCHFDQGVELNIRTCEKCHGVKSLHNIQFDYDATNGTAGYGHIGENWDCWGCHGWFDYYSVYSSDNPLAQSEVSSAVGNPPAVTGPTIPFIDSINPSEITAGQVAVIIIEGNNFENTYNGIEYTSEVILYTDTGIVLVKKPDSITPTEIVVTIPETLKSGNYDIRVVKAGDVKSNLIVLTVLPEIPDFMTVIRK
jgi:hypothetical protein